MRQLKSFGLVVVLLVGASLTVKADPWDVATPNDNNFNTAANHLTHGSGQTHDLATVGGLFDPDWFVANAAPLSSYEVIVDGATGDLDLGSDAALLSLRDGTGALVSNSTVLNEGDALTLNWANTSSAVAPFLLRVAAPACASCNSNSQYQIRLFDTTIAVPRFNNSNGQVTVLVVQNTLDRPVVTHYSFWAASGAQIGSTFTSNFGEHGVQALNLSTLPALQNQGGALTIAHTAGYGGLAAKAIALDPASGFSFDSPGLYKPR